MTQPTQPLEIRQGHPYYMHDAILSQPAAIAEMLGKHAAQADEVAAILASKRRLYLVGIGTSWHAALIAEHWFRRLAGSRVEVQGWHSFEFCAYPPPLSQDDAVIIISHRGTKTYSFLALELARERGAYTLAVTSTDPGPRIRVADVEFNTVAPERSAAFTVSYTAALTVMAMLASALGAKLGAASGSDSDFGGNPAQLRAQLESVPGVAAGIINRSDAVERAVQRFQERQRFISVGWGPNTANAYEVALKIKETSAADCEGLQVEQLLHGPFCSIGPDCLVTLIAPPGPGYERALNIARAAAAVDAPVWALVQEGDEELSALVTESFPMPPLAELWSPLAYVVPLQLFTYYLALARDKHPDRFQQDNPAQAEARTHYEL